MPPSEAASSCSELDGTNIVIILPAGAACTPNQLELDVHAETTPSIAPRSKSGTASPLRTATREILMEGEREGIGVVLDPERGKLDFTGAVPSAVPAARTSTARTSSTS